MCVLQAASIKSKILNDSFIEWVFINVVCWLPSQIRRALLQILFPDKPFSWLIHISIAFCLIFVVNLLVIFVPSIRDIFGIIGKRLG